MKNRNMLFILVLLILFILVVLSVIFYPKSNQSKIDERLNDVRIPSEYEILFSGGYGGSGHGAYVNFAMKIKNELAISCNGELTGYGAMGTGYRKDCSNETNIFIDYNETISAKIAEIKELNFTGAHMKQIGERECILNLTSIQKDPYMRGFCFKEGILVNYWGRGGYGANKFDWSVKGYELSQNEMQEIPELTS